MKRPFPEEHLFDPADMPPDAGWDPRSIMDRVAAGVIPEDFRAFFDRDPERRPPDDPDAVLAPADGILELEPRADTVRLLTHLRITDIHVQRVPFAGTVLEVGEEGEGCFYPDDDRHWLGVRKVTSVSSGLGVYRVSQLTTLVTRRIETYLQPGQAVRAGDRLGRIRLGSTVVLELPPGSVDLACATGQRVRAGETVLARRRISEPTGEDTP